MKKIILIFCLAFLSSNTFAQYYGNEESPFSFSIVGGGAIAYFQVKPSTLAFISNSAEPVGCAGVTLDYKFNNYFSISPGLLLSGKGGKTEGLYGTFNQDISIEYQFYYLEASLNFVGHIPIGDQANIFLGAGPYYANSIFGTSKIITDGIETNPSVKFGRNGDFKTNDYGITSLVGFKTERGYIIGLSFDLGLPNIRQSNPSNIDNDQFKNRSIYLSFGKSF